MLHGILVTLVTFFTFFVGMNYSYHCCILCTLKHLRYTRTLSNVITVDQSLSNL
jgi:hypothetical protein